MLGDKINEFDRSNGTVEDFNRIFPKTPLDGVGEVEILEIVDAESLYKQNCFKRLLKLNGQIFEHDFGSNNFINEDLSDVDVVRFKYYARDFDGSILNTAFSMEELAEKMGCLVGIIKSRTKKPITSDNQTMFKFNVTRREL